MGAGEVNQKEIGTVNERKAREMKQIEESGLQD